MAEALSLADAQGLTLPQLLRRRARQHPGATALRRKQLGIWEELSWRDYEEAARHVALGLHGLGLRRGDRLAIASEGTPEWFFADLGAEMIGVEVVGIYPTNPWNELCHIVRHCRARAIVCGDQEQTDKVLAALASEGGLPDLAQIICVDTKGMRRYPAETVTSFAEIREAGRAAASDPEAAAWLESEIEAGRIDDVNILIYTSGTTGPPKGAMLSHRNLTAATCGFAQVSGLVGHPFEVVCYLPLCHVGERSYSMVLHLVLGGVVSFAESIDTVAGNIREIAPTFFLGVPRIWEKLRENLLFRAREPGNVWRPLFALALARARRGTERPGGGLAARLERAFWQGLFFRNVQRAMGLDRTRVRVCGGGAVSEETLRFFAMLGLPILQAYGLSESSGMAFAQRPGRGTIGGCGEPLPGTQVQLAEDGEILLRSPAVFRGYLFDEDATRAVLAPDGWLRTGDIGTIDDGGELTIVDRKKAIIITSGGKNIAPSEIENALKDSPYIREAIVVGEGQKFLGGLIQIDFETMGRWASERDIAYTSYRSLATHRAVRELIQGVVDDVNARFARVENVRRFAILEKELDHDDGELTATQKVRRSAIERKFTRELETIYGEGA